LAPAESCRQAQYSKSLAAIRCSDLFSCSPSSNHVSNFQGGVETAMLTRSNSLEELTMIVSTPSMRSRNLFHHQRSSMKIIHPGLHRSVNTSQSIMPSSKQSIPTSVDHLINCAWRASNGSTRTMPSFLPCARITSTTSWNGKGILKVTWVDLFDFGWSLLKTREAKLTGREEIGSS
jgi:hypothetical protein